MLCQVEGMVVRTLKYGETSLIFDMYTRQYGLMSFIANGVRKPKSQLPLSFFQLMNWLEVVAYVQEKKSLSRIKEARLQLTYQRLPFDLKRRCIGLFATELLQKSIKDSESNTPLYEWLCDVFRFLDSTSQPVQNLPLGFMLGLSIYLGFRPDGQWAEATPYLHLLSGRFVPSPQANYTLNRTSSYWISEMIHCGWEELHRLQIDREIRRSVLTDMIRYYQCHVDHMQMMQTQQIFGEVFDS